MKLKLKQNIGTSVDIDIELSEIEIKNEKCSDGKWNQNCKYLFIHQSIFLHLKNKKQLLGL